MAAIERRAPSLDDFVGKNWSTWAERAGVTATDGLDVENCSKNGKKAAEAMSLSKDDMSIFGLYPGHDDFYLVVCSHCGQVVKPQAFEEHCERRHSTLAKLNARLHSVPQPQQRHHLGNFPSHGTNPASALSWEARGQSTSHLQAASPSASTTPQYRHSKHSKDAVRHSPLEKLSSYSSHTESSTFKQLSPLEPSMSSPPPSLRDPPWPHVSTPPGRPSSDQPPIQSQRRDGSLASAGPAHRVPRPYNKVASKRECDLDKHCGVLDPDRKKVCTRLLTCNIHSIHQRRKVVGRSKNFDQLVAELKTKVREKGTHLLGGGSSGVQSPSPETREQTGMMHCRRLLASLPTFSRSTAVSECTPEVEKQWQDEGTDPAPSPLVCGRISSDESDADGPEEYLEFPSSTAHPRPLSVCSFGSHVFGHGFFTFDRRLHHLRSALSSMLELHISTHRWKKIPQAVDLQATTSSSKTITSSTPSTIATLSSISSHSIFQIGSHINSSVKTASSCSSLVCCCPGRPHAALQSESSGGSIDCGHLLSAGKLTSVCQMGPERSKNPVDHPSKQILKLRVEAASAAALRKRKAPSQEGEHSGPDRNCIILEDQGHPRSATTSSLPSYSKAPVPSPHPHGQTNGILSPSSKPRPQHPSSESAKSIWTYRRTNSSAGHSSSLDLSSSTSNSHSRVGMGDSGLHEQGTVRCFDRQGHVKTHKGGSIEEYSPPTKSLAHHLPSGSSTTTSPRSNFYLWKDSKGGGLAGGVEKKLGMQKPKLHH